ncbi:MAG: stress response translation initiation inhibitor YciH [Candidatus Aenigmarchaeota archaeon]|nr:stress response translation initiation inhibitor YciH [Candidatus Aenigmarchaeota archaeon]
MADICTICGLPRDICTCGAMSKEEQKIIIYTQIGRFKKKITIISGLDPKQVDLRDLQKTLKMRLACGGTVKKDEIWLQGEHKEKVRHILVEEGFKKESIEVR